MLKREDITVIPLAKREGFQLDFEKERAKSEKTVDLPAAVHERVASLAKKMAYAKANNKSIMLAFGAHLIKNGLSPVLQELASLGFVTHFATNGAGSIHDLEFALVGKSGEDVRANTKAGMFGTWDETGYITDAACLYFGAKGLGYGASVGQAILKGSETSIETKEVLETELQNALKKGDFARASALADLLVRHGEISSRGFDFAYKNKENSLQYFARKNEIPFTVHPGIGYDIIYLHPICTPSTIGRACEVDFLTYASGVANLDGGGVYLSVGSAIMSPMIFEKSMSLANNIRMGKEKRGNIKDFHIAVVDLQDGGGWDWSSGEPPKDNPAYYLRFCKTFSRMGGDLTYFELDNRLFLTALLEELKKC